MSFMRLTFGDISALAAVGGVLLVPMVIGGATGASLDGVAGAGTNEADVIRTGELGADTRQAQISAGGGGSDGPAGGPEGARIQRGARSTIAPAREPRGGRGAPADSSSAEAPPSAPVSSTPSSPDGPPGSQSPPTGSAAVPPPPPPPPPPPLISLPPPPPPPLISLPDLPPVPPLPPLPPIEPQALPKLPIP
jgi:hypothetical protein